MLLDKITKGIWLISEFWDEEVCDAFINETNNIGYRSDNSELLRTNSVVKFETQELSNIIWEQLTELDLTIVDSVTPIGINTWFRFYKYLPGQEFKRHKDCSFHKDEFERSYYSLLIYLNDNFEGGETIFDEIVLQPKRGTAVIFPHHLMHSGSKIISGVKYILRADIMCIFK
ncbi:MAG: 2OG-Fe(II) oxygenase [Chitinophagaceae bacterium]|nr:2OG-Fe(II) oxygenase [Chitinophagaceae bacterium]